MTHGHQNHRAGRIVRQTVTVATPPVQIVEPSLQKFWSEKYLFSIQTLGLKRSTARDWATRAVRVKLETTELEFNCSH